MLSLADLESQTLDRAWLLAPLSDSPAALTLGAILGTHALNHAYAHMAKAPSWAPNQLNKSDDSWVTRS